MSAGKFLAGTTLAAPAIGGGGYITYKELTKEENTEPSVGSEDAKAVSAPSEPEARPNADAHEDATEDGEGPKLDESGGVDGDEEEALTGKSVAQTEGKEEVENPGTGGKPAGPSLPTHSLADSTHQEQSGTLEQK